jgi:hypothetical protein
MGPTERMVHQNKTKGRRIEAEDQSLAIDDMSRGRRVCTLVGTFDVTYAVICVPSTRHVHSPQRPSRSPRCILELGRAWIFMAKSSQDYVATQGEQHSSKAYFVSKGGDKEDINVDTRDLLSTDAA